MKKNITLTAEEQIIKSARLKALKKNKSLNNLFQAWLVDFINDDNLANKYDKFMKKVSYVNAGKKFTREELNAR